jgi:thioredoxin reductase (NADPH)
MLSGFKLNLNTCDTPTPGQERDASALQVDAVALQSDAAACSDIEEIIIIGSGSSGWAAAIYAARANRRPLLIAGDAIGGQIVTTTEVENYPGFPAGIQGPELSERMQQQAERFGTRVVFDAVSEIDVHGPPYTVATASGASYRARALILATGAAPRRLEVPGEERLTGRGVSYCATCDGFFFRGKEVVVVGGGDSALQESLLLAKYAQRVRIVHRRHELRAGAALQNQAMANPKIEFVLNSVVSRILGDQSVESLELQDVETGRLSTLSTDGVFIYIGHLPNNGLLEGKLALDDHGYVITDKWMRTSVPGIFAAGEIQDPRYRQVVTSVGQGAAAALEAEKYLAALECDALYEFAPKEADTGSH